MNRDDLYKSFAEVDDEALAYAELRHTPRRVSSRMRLIAASLALALCLFGISCLVNLNRTQENGVSWFVIVADAADGGPEELHLYDGTLNSGGTGKPLFGVDVPLFCFTVKPASWENNKAAYFGLDISVSRDGKIVDSLDDHMTIMHKIPVSGSDASDYERVIVGWVEGSADIVITISEKDTGRLVEEQTVNVRYFPETQAYQLTVTNVQTNDAEE